MKPTAFLLLVTFALGLSAGPHPCHAGMAGPAGEPEGAGKTPPANGAPAAVALERGACHGAAAPAPAPAADAVADSVADPVADSAAKSAPRDCCGEGGRSLCERACTSIAVLGAGAPAPGGRAVQELTAAPTAHPPASFAFRIDHIPLV